ncbi:hypothetical protein F6B41_25500 [Microbacterium lushaniae]|nr:hypothetical protein F6B41_33840 [Microbacterium lushaniae]KAA9149510.1 hypothetical protein F6B41_25500 [Microbacterium lushaniae]
MIPRPTKPRPDRLRAALALDTASAASRDWLAITMSGTGEYPRAGAGSHPAPGDLARAVTIARNPADAREHAGALIAIARIAERTPDLLAPADSLGRVTFGGGTSYRSDEYPGSSLGADRATVAALSETDRATVERIVRLYATVRDLRREANGASR